MKRDTSKPSLRPLRHLTATTNGRKFLERELDLKDRDLGRDEKQGEAQKKWLAPSKRWRKG